MNARGENRIKKELPELKKLSIKYLWVYTIALFSVAFVLILVSAMQQKRVNETIDYYKQQVIAQQDVSAGTQRSVDNLTEENNYLKEEIAKEQFVNDKLSITINGNVEEIADLNREKDALSQLCMAQNEYISGRYKNAGSILEKIDSKYLSDDMKKMVAYLNSRVNR
ncbi:hypothetical protein SDC9_138110 [bioreactor metagenome]|uniref:Uncharacterized protein n=1 Tax=bioreactor metagenome TaxID=1076179 RepID=A0A645DP18_9ZZZZ